MQQTLAEGTLFIDVILSDGDSDTDHCLDRCLRAHHLRGRRADGDDLRLRHKPADGPRLRRSTRRCSRMARLTRRYDRDESRRKWTTITAAPTMSIPAQRIRTTTGSRSLRRTPTADQAIGHLSTAAGELASLFFFGAPNYGADGPLDSETQDERTDALSFVLSTDPAETNLVATALPGTSLENSDRSRAHDLAGPGRRTHDRGPDCGRRRRDRHRWRRLRRIPHLADLVRSDDGADAGRPVPGDRSRPVGRARSLPKRRRIPRCSTSKSH